MNATLHFTLNHQPVKVSTDPERLLLWVLRTELGAGQFGPSGRYGRWREDAEVIAFLLHKGDRLVGAPRRLVVFSGDAGPTVGLDADPGLRR